VLVDAITGWIVDEGQAGPSSTLRVHILTTASAVSHALFAIDTPSCFSRERGVVVMLWSSVSRQPSVSHFERGRGRGDVVVVGKQTTPLACVCSKGGTWHGGKALCLTFGARECLLSVVH
jgi:hypothetical protein